MPDETVYLEEVMENDVVTPAGGQAKIFLSENDDHVKAKKSDSTIIDLEAGGGGGEANTSSNVGTGSGLAKAKNGVDLPFKSLKGTLNKIALTENPDDVTMNVGSDVIQEGDARLSDARTPLAHSHPQSDVTNLVTDLSNKSAIGHTHVKADITDFSHTHLKADITDFAHSHPISEVTGLQTELDNKLDDSQRGAANGVASLGATTKIPIGEVPTGASSTTVCIGDDSRLSNKRNPTIASEATGDIMYHNGTDWVRLAKGTLHQKLKMNAAATIPEWKDDIVDIIFIIDGGGSVITTGQKGHLPIDFACTILGWTILADQSGSIVVDVWKDTYANFPPTVADTIAGTEKPTLASAQKNQDLALTTWTDSIVAGDILAFNVDSVTTVQRVVVALKCKKLE